MKGNFTLSKFRCKTFGAWNKIVSRHVLWEKLQSLVGVLHIPVEIRLKRKWVVAPQLQRGSFRDSDVAIRLVTDWAPEPLLNQWTQLNKSLYSKSNQNNVPCVDKRVKWNSTHSAAGVPQASRWTPRSWWSSEEAVSCFPGDSPQTEVSWLGDLNPSCSEVEEWQVISISSSDGDCRGS